MRGKGSKLGEPCPKFRLSQDRLPIVICPHEKLGEGEFTKLGEGKGNKLGEGERH